MPWVSRSELLLLTGLIFLGKNLRMRVGCYASRKYSEGFTLIEMLVVIAVIAILASMLMPALMKVHHTARQVQCASNLKHMGMANMMYLDNWKTPVPVAFVSGGYPNNTLWRANLEFNSYLGESSHIYKKDNLCPELPERKPAGATLSVGESYGHTIAGIVEVSGEWMVVKQYRIKNPGGKIMFADGMYWKLGAWHTYKLYFLDGEIPGCFEYPVVNNAAAFRHMENLNAVHWDGHAKSHHVSEFCTTADADKLMQLYQ